MHRALTRRLWIVLAALGTLALTACGSQDSGDSQASGDAAESVVAAADSDTDTPTSCGTTNIPVSSEYPNGGNGWPEYCDCNQEYALCIAASCDPESGTCGVRPAVVPSRGPTWVPCDQDGVDAGTCGVCYVFDGISRSDKGGREYPLTCDQLAPSPETVHSTYSDNLLDNYDFDWKIISTEICDVSTITSADCMGDPCTRNDSQYDIVLGGDTIATANCSCTIDETDSDKDLEYQALEAVDADCDAVWSVG